MKRSFVLFALLLVALAAQSGIAQTQKQFVLQTAKALETAPLDKETQKMRVDALRWVIETDEVSIIACGGVFSTMLEKKNKNSTDMTGAYMIGMAAYKIQNPENAADENAAQLAGIELSLRVYEALVKEKPKTKFEPIEALIVKRNNGELAALIAAAECGKK
jgi:hypothetical protein